MSTDPNTLLVVDDEELNREGLARRLRRHGYTVALAENGRQAIELLEEHCFDLVLLDLVMPGMSGLEVLKALRHVDALTDLPVIMVTAKGGREDMVEALELGANDYMTKPLDFPVVLARIRAQLGRRRATARVTELEQKLDARNRELAAAAAELAAAKERGARDLAAAARIRHALLPTLPPQVPGARLAWAFRPGGQPAGTFPNLFRLDNRHLGLGVIDVSGPGVAAALLALAAAHELSRLASATGGGGAPPAPPAAVVARLSQQLAGETSAGHTVTLLYGILDLDTGEFRFVAAGHPGPVHVRHGSRPARLEVTGPPLGAGVVSPPEQAVTLQPGDRLVLDTAGLTRARNAAGEHFGTRRLLSALEQTGHLPLGEGLNALLENVEGWRGNTPRHDDLAILAAEMAASETPAGRAVPEPA